MKAITCKNEKMKTFIYTIYNILGIEYIILTFILLCFYIFVTYYFLS